MTQREKELTEQVKQLTHLVEEMRKELTTAYAKLDAANAKIAELEERINKNSQNSSKAPSTDGYQKPLPKGLRKASGKKQGGQRGHKGSRLHINKEPTETVFYMPEKCAECPRQAKCRKRACVAETRYVADAVVDITLTAHESLEIVCPRSKERRRGPFPTDVNAPMQYGDKLNALVVAFHTVGAVSTNRIHELFGNVFEIPLSTGTVINMVSNCAAKVKPVVDRDRDKIAAGPLAHFDETGCRVNQRLNWVHVASTSSETYLCLSEKRGSKGMDEGGVLPAFHGIAVHDCWAPYWKYDMEHGICCAHLLRELNGIQENHPEQKWPSYFSKLLLDMKGAKEAAILAGQDGMRAAQYEKLLRRYDRILATAYRENPEPKATPGKKGRRKRGKVLALIDRLRKYKDAVCLFIKNFAVPFDNNQAERDLRMVKVKTKVSGCFRTEEGCRDFLNILAYTSTAKKQKINPFHAILLAIMELVS